MTSNSRRCLRPELEPGIIPACLPQVPSICHLLLWLPGRSNFQRLYLLLFRMIDLPRPPRARRPGPQRVCSHRCLASQARPGPAADAETCCLRAAAGLDGKPGTPMVCYGRHIGRTSQNRVGTALRTWPLHGLYRQVLAPVRSIPRDGN